MVDRNGRDKRYRSKMDGVVVVHAAVNGGMITNFGRFIAQRLVEEGAELHFIASRYPVFGFPQPVEDFKALGGEYHGLPIREYFAPLELVLSILQMARLLRKLRPQFLHTRGSVMGFAGRVVGRAAGVPFVLHHQDDLYFRDQSHGPFKRRVVARIETLLSRLSDRSFFVSQAVLDDAIQAGFDPRKCILVGHDLNEVFQKSLSEPLGERVRRHPILERYGIPENARVVGSIGRLAHLKGMDTFVAIAERVCVDRQDCFFFVKGDGPLKNDLRERISRSGLSSRIILCADELPAAELPELYRSFDVFVLPTRREGFGMVFAEAMSMGVPVVGPRMAPITEVVPTDCGILVEPGDIDAYCVAIENLLRDDSLRLGISSRGRKHAQETWSGRHSAQKVVDAYLELMGD